MQIKEWKNHVNEDKDLSYTSQLKRFRADLPILTSLETSTRLVEGKKYKIMTKQFGI